MSREIIYLMRRTRPRCLFGMGVSTSRYLCTGTSPLSSTPCRRRDPLTLVRTCETIFPGRSHHFLPLPGAPGLTRNWVSLPSNPELATNVGISFVWGCVELFKRSCVHLVTRSAPLIQPDLCTSHYCFVVYGSAPLPPPQSGAQVLPRCSRKKRSSRPG